jgi:hypothetical protein
MPRSVAVGLVCLSVLGLLGLAGTAMIIADLAKNGIWSDDGIAAQLHLPGRGISALVTLAVPILMARHVKGIAKRNRRARGDVVVMGLVLSLLFGVLFGVLALVIMLDGGIVEGIFLALAVSPFIALFAIPSYALSRPSAKAWFAASPG